MQSESFLSYQRGLEEGRKASNCRTLLGMAAIPTDNHIRAMLDPVHPCCLQPAFDGVLETMRRRDGFAPFRRLGGRVLIALDGTEYVCSQKLGCPQCLTRKRSNGRIESYHSMLCATVVAPGHALALPLMPVLGLDPGIIAPQDGAEKQDCERNAVRRWLATHADRVKDLRPIFPGDDLFACQPVVDAMVAAGGDVLLTARPTSHKALYDFMAGATPESRVLKQEISGTTLTCRYRWFKEVPLRDGADSRLVDGVGVTVTDAKGKTTDTNAFVTSLDVTRDSVAEIVSCARALWKIQNESSNVLKSNGYHLEHNFGHGKQNLAMMFAALNMLAFAIHTVCDCLTVCDYLETIWIQARTAKRARKRFFEHLRTITAYLVFPDWNTLMQTLVDSKPPPEIEAQIAR